MLTSISLFLKLPCRYYISISTHMFSFFVSEHLVFFNGSPMLVRTCLLFSSLSISFFFNGPPVLVCTCLLFSSSRISLFYFSRSPVPEGICFPTVIVFLWFSTHSVFTGVLSDVFGYDSSLLMMLSHICTGHIRLPVRHWVTVALFFLLFYVLNFHYLIGGCNRCCAWVCIIFCRIWCRPSVGCVFFFLPLWGSSSTRMTTCQRKRRLRWVDWWLW